MELLVLLCKNKEFLTDDILHVLDDGITTYTYRKRLAEKVVKFLNERNEVKNLFCEKEK